MAPPRHHRAHPQASLRALAVERGMTHEEHVPLMRLDGQPQESNSSALRVRRLAPEDAKVHADIAARGFGAPVEVFAALVAQPLVSAAGLAYYVGEVDGDPVTTGLGLTIGDHVGVFSIATPPEQRRRGYGAAITARIVRDGYTAGARWAWLQSSKDGYRVYQRLGFTTVATWVLDRQLDAGSSHVGSSRLTGGCPPSALSTVNAGCIAYQTVDLTGVVASIRTRPT